MKKFLIIIIILLILVAIYFFFFYNPKISENVNNNFENYLNNILNWTSSVARAPHLSTTSQLSHLAPPHSAFYAPSTAPVGF